MAFKNHPIRSHWASRKLTTAFVGSANVCCCNNLEHPSQDERKNVVWVGKRRSCQIEATTFGPMKFENSANSDLVSGLFKELTQKVLTLENAGFELPTI